MSHKKLQQNISRLMALLLCLMLILPGIPAVRAAGGSCGSSLEWSFDGSTLTISGSGAMTNFDSDNLPPWYEIRSQILQVSLPAGLTRVGSFAFYECINLSSVTLPSTVEVIGEAAFYRNSSMTMLSLNEGLRNIGRKAFSECSALADLRLPGTVTIIGNYAFSMCSRLTYVTIPSFVSSMGSGVFSYCDNLIRVDIESSTQIPSWSFYGCDSLEVVTIQGETIDPDSLKVPNVPENVLPSSPNENNDTSEPDPTEAPAESQPVNPAPNTGIASGATVTTGSSGEQIVESTTVTKTDNSTTVSSTTTTDGEIANSTTEITSTVQNDNGWKDVIDKVNLATIGGNTNNVDVTVYLPNSDTVSADVLEELADKNVTLNIQTQSGGKVTLDCDQMGEIKNDLILGYTILPAEDVPEELAGCTVYKLNFNASMQQNTEIIVRLPGGHSYSTATLYYGKNSELEKVQSVLVDGAGDAHWYLGSVDGKADYYIGINVPGLVDETPIIPEVLYDEYKIVDQATGKEYVITGRTSSWGMTLGQVMSILAAVMVTVIVVVGVVMFIWNKKRLKNGYVPDWDDDYE